MFPIEASGQRRTKITLKTTSGKSTSGSRGKETTDGRRQKFDEINQWLIIDGDSIDASDKVLFSGYDKTLSSSIESMLITNELPVKIGKVSLRIVYLDMKGRMLHSRELVLTCDIPSGETRKTDFRSWDSQHTYYYYKGPAPRRSVTPYKVKVTLLGVSTDEE